MTRSTYIMIKGAWLGSAYKWRLFFIFARCVYNFASVWITRDSVHASPDVKSSADSSPECVILPWVRINNILNGSRIAVYVPSVTIAPWLYGMRGICRGQNLSHSCEFSASGLQATGKDEIIHFPQPVAAMFLFYPAIGVVAFPSPRYRLRFKFADGVTVDVTAKWRKTGCWQLCLKERRRQQQEQPLWNTTDSFFFFFWCNRAGSVVWITAHKTTTTRLSLATTTTVPIDVS